ncbi:hypothetical protein J7X21_001990 [Vibrio parahaemolyticus]|nr:hypothetical protein [Vibrio parahaemolyticus]EHH2462798.1 hypothetical protein [Vibrio parahaemolyticus]EJG1580754.1 hypothetical protein [Vibrio parahaemolyticus]
MKEQRPARERTKEPVVAAARPVMKRSDQKEINQAKRAAQSQTLEKPASKWIARVAGIGLVAASLTFGFSNQISNTLKSDSLSRQDSQAIVQQFNAAMAAGESIFVPVNFLDRDERARAKAASGLDEEKAEHLLKEAEGGYISLAWVTVWDNLAEDGDVIEVSAGGMTRTVPILNEPTTIVVPYSIDSAQIKIRGIRDGGGGITVAARTANGSLPLPPMSEGEVRTLRFN